MELRGKYIQQLRELHSLFEGGALSELEFVEGGALSELEFVEGGALSELEFIDEKESILCQLKMMSPPRQ